VDSRRRPPRARQARAKQGKNDRQENVKPWPQSAPDPYSQAVESRPRILFVEDERSISEPFSHALEREGFEAVVAPTAAEALRLARSIDPDLVLLDLMLPDGDGRELGADDYVVKPFSGPEVIARIRAVLRRTGSSPSGEGVSRVQGLELD